MYRLYLNLPGYGPLTRNQAMLEFEQERADWALENIGRQMKPDELVQNTLKGEDKERAWSMTKPANTSSGQSYLYRFSHFQDYLYFRMRWVS